MATAKPNFPKFQQRPVTTPAGIARFPKVHEADEYNGKRTFNCKIVFPGDTDLSKITEAAYAVAAEAFPTRPAAKVNVLLKDGDEAEKDGKPIEELRGKMFLNASCQEKYPPKIVGPDKKPLPEGVEVRGGDTIKLIIAPQPCDTPVKGTITFRLLAVQLIAKGSGGNNVDVDSMFDDEGEGFGAGPADGKASSGVDAGGGADDIELPF